MKALSLERYGRPEDLRLVEKPQPVPGPGQVLVRVKAVSLNSADWRLMVADPFIMRFMGVGLLRPKHGPGIDMAGVVEALGPGAARLKPGQRVVADLFNHGHGSLAEYVAVPEDALSLMPEGLGFEEASAFPLAGVTALCALRDAGRVAPGMEVLIHGASGGVGVFAVQLAKAMGARVTAVCSSSKLAQAMALGADRAIDYTKEDFVCEGERYDLILGINGNRSLADYKRALLPGGRYLMVGGGGRQLFQALALGKWYSLGGTKRLGSTVSAPCRENLDALLEYYRAGKLKAPIDQVYPLEQAAEAYRAFGAGHAAGKLVVRI